MTPEDFIKRRKNYAYPTIGLQGDLDALEEIQFSATIEFDEYQRGLLTHETDEKVVLGYLSTIYWGHYSAQNHLDRPARAMGKVRMARDGFERERRGRNERIKGIIAYGINTVAIALRHAYDLLGQNKYAEAMEFISLLPQLKVAFSSKVCAFLMPEKCGVIDSIISKKYPTFGFTVLIIPGTVYLITHGEFWDSLGEY
jgi:hypothetical protein